VNAGLRAKSRGEGSGLGGVYQYVGRRFPPIAPAPLLILALLAPSAWGANFDVVTTADNTFSPASVTITVGDTVTWSNSTSTYHNVVFDDGQFNMPQPPAPGPWSVSRTFMAPGTYTYYCEVHKTQGMLGTVAVMPAPPPGGGGSPPPPPDMAPVSSLISSASQRVAKLFVRASMNEAGTLTATGTVSVPGAAKVYRFKPSTRMVSANQSIRLRLRLGKKPLRAVKRALRRGKRLKAKIALTARDMTGHETVRRQTIRLKR
jgi:plastocyanin